jgi:triacylglycerol lipase
MYGPLERVVAPIAAVAHAARRPTTYRGHAREAASTLVTMGLWPMGFVDAGVRELRRGWSDDGPVDAPVLLVHGYGANKSNWLFVRRYLHQAGFGRVHALNYNPLSDDVPGLAERCVERAEELMDHFGVDRVHLVGHSMGGVIARYAVQVLGLSGVGVCITVASPHGGVRLAEYGSRVGTLAPLVSAAQLRPGSEVMTLLRYSARPLPTRFVAYYSNLDLIVPARRAMILEPELAATNILVKDHGHLSVMLSRRLAHSIVDQLGAAEGLPGYGTPVRGIETAPAEEAGHPPSSAADGHAVG